MSSGDSDYPGSGSWQGWGASGREDGALHSAASRKATIAIISDRGSVRLEVIEDCYAAGISNFRSFDMKELRGRINDGGKFESLIDDIILIDIPHPTESDIDLLICVEKDAERTGVQLLVSTTVDALDDVFGSLTGGFAQILVSPSRADQMIALGEALARCRSAVRELSGDDHIALLRLSEQVSQIAQRLERISGSGSPGDVPAFSFGAAPDGPAHRAQGDRQVRTIRPALPDPRLIRKIIRNRQLRSKFLDGALFADPAWDMLLDLTAARVEHVRVTVSSLCIASNVPSSTALRWIGQMTTAGLIVREEDDGDRRRAFLTLSDDAALAMARLFAELDLTQGRLI